MKKFLALTVLFVSTLSLQAQVPDPSPLETRVSSLEARVTALEKKVSPAVTVTSVQAPKVYTYSAQTQSFEVPVVQSYTVETPAQAYNYWPTSNQTCVNGQCTTVTTRKKLFSR